MPTGTFYCAIDPDHAVAVVLTPSTNQIANQDGTSDLTVHLDTGSKVELRGETAGLLRVAESLGVAIEKRFNGAK